MSKRQNIISASLLLWLGFLLAISFMEAWLKFHAPGVTLAIGLSIGKLIFAALNKMEWLFAIIIIGCIVLEKKVPNNFSLTLTALAVGTLLIDTFWLLPQLDARAAGIIAGQRPPHSVLHFYYVGGEMLKVLALGTAAYQSYSSYFFAAQKEKNAFHSTFKTKLS